MGISEANRASAEEVRQFVASGLKPSLDPATSLGDCEITVELDDLERLMFGLADPPTPGWVDIRERELSMFYSFEAGDVCALASELALSLEPVFWHQVDLAIGDIVPNRLIESVVSDMANLVLIRATFGPTLQFWETIFTAYRAGGIPIGWSSTYPEGKMIVLLPAHHEGLRRV